MQPYRFEFVHLKGETNKVADALSRTPEFECTALEVFPAQPLHQDELIKAAQQDQAYTCPSPIGGQAWEKRQGLWTIRQGDQERLWVPDNIELRTKLISEHHETLLAGHFGVKRILACL